MRDAPAFRERADEGSLNLETFLTTSKTHPKAPGWSSQIPSKPPYTEAHNTWVFNKPSTVVIMPVGDLSQHVLLNLCYMLQNGLVLFDDIHHQPIPGIEKYTNIVDVANVWPITFVDQWSLAELTVELGRAVMRAL